MVAAVESGDPHTIMLQRLAFEYKERQRCVDPPPRRRWPRRPHADQWPTAAPGACAFSRALDEIKALTEQKDTVAAAVRSKRELVDQLPKRAEALRAVRRARGATAGPFPWCRP